MKVTIVNMFIHARGIPLKKLKANSFSGINHFRPKEGNRFCVVLVK